MGVAAYNQAEIQARKSLVPQTEALRINSEFLPADVRKRFKEILNSLIDSQDEDERQELLVSLSELLDPDGRIGVRTISVNAWLSESPEARNLDRKKKRFAENLRRMIQSHGITQKDLAQKLDVTASCVSQIASGKYKPQPDTLERLAEALRCEVSDLWSDG